MQEMKIPLQDLALKVQGGLMRNTTVSADTVKHLIEISFMLSV